MISLSPPTASHAVAALLTADGFAWWYLDLVDGNGNGIVLIWSFGLPFLPDIRNTVPSPSRRPSIVLSGYERGKESFYTFREFEPESVDWDPATGVGSFGGTAITLIRSTTDVAVHVRLDLDVPGSGPALGGVIEVRGPVCQGGQWGHSHQHQWMPLTAATTGSAQFTGAWTASITGRAYVDHNCGTTPMTSLGIARWSWGRIAFPARELIWYTLSPEGGGPDEGVVVEIGATGATRVVEQVVESGPSRFTWSGVSAPRTVRFRDPDGEPVTVRILPPVDDAPFYQRALVVAECAGHEGHGTTEVVIPPRLDAAWFRPFVEMRLKRPGVEESRLLPLFSGATRGRWARWLGAGGALT